LLARSSVIGEKKEDFIAALGAAEKDERTTSERASERANERKREREREEAPFAIALINAPLVTRSELPAIPEIALYDLAHFLVGRVAIFPGK